MSFDKSIYEQSCGKLAKYCESIERYARESSKYYVLVIILMSAYGSLGKFKSNVGSSLSFMLNRKFINKIIIWKFQPALL